MKIVIALFSALLYFSTVESSHFLGGSVTWAPLDNINLNPMIPIRIIQSYQWRESLTHCDQSYIINQTPLIPPRTYDQLQCVTIPAISCDNYVSLDIAGYCTDFSTVIDSSSSYNLGFQNLTLNASFCLAYQGGVWPRVLVSCEGICYLDSARWSIGCCIDLTPRPEGWINTPPVPTVISPIRVPINTIKNIKIPVTDVDNDITRCRWAMYTNELDECGDICGPTFGCTLDSENCTLTFDSTGTVIGDLYPVALMVEDFYNEKTKIPFSNVSIQFLIEIVGAVTCLSKPIIDSNLSNVTFVEVGMPFTFSLTIISDCPGVSIIDFFRQAPLYMKKSNITFDRATNASRVTETWTSTSVQVGTHVYCAVATDSQLLQSDLYCRTFIVGFGEGSGEGSGAETTTTTITTYTTVSTTSITTTTTSTSTSSTSSTSTSASKTSTSSTTSSSTSSTSRTTSTTSTSTSSSSSSTSTTTTTSTSTSVTSVTTTTATTTTTTAQESVTVTVQVVVTVPTTDNLQMIALGLGLGIPLLLGITGATLFGVFGRRFALFSARRIDENTEEIVGNIANSGNDGENPPSGIRDYREEYIQPGNNDETNYQSINIGNYENNNLSVQIGAPDYREEYIETGNNIEANNQTKYLDGENPLPDDSLFEYLSLSAFELQALNETGATTTTTTILSTSINSLPVVDVQNTAQYSSNTNISTRNVSILQQAYAKQKIK